MKKTILFLIFLLIIAFVNANENSEINRIEKIQYFFYSGKLNKAAELIKEFDLTPYFGKEKDLILRKFKSIGDMLIENGNTDLADIVFKKIQKENPGYWQIGNSLEKSKRTKGRGFYSIGNAFAQFTHLLKNFEAKLLFYEITTGSIFLSGILLFFITSIYLFVRNFKLASTDFFIDDNGDLQKVKVFLAFGLLFWPIIFLSGWASYPFLFAGFFWVYMNSAEKRMILIQIVIIIIGALFFSFHNFISSVATSNDIEIAKNIMSGRLYSKKEYKLFSNDLKVLQAYAFFKNKNYEKSIDMLLSTGEGYQNLLKLNLMGNIYFRSDNIEKSLKYLKTALEIDEKNKTALYNFALVLSKQENAKVFKSYAKRYPPLVKLKKTVGIIKDPFLEQNFLWKRLMNNSGKSENFIKFISEIIKNFFKIPVIYFSFVFLLYIFLIKRIFPELGRSEFCKKCGKIIDKSQSVKANNYCEQCYELFQLKDVVFMEAKIGREEEIKRKSIKRKIVFLIFSILLPGFVLLENKKMIRFSILSYVYLTLFIFSFSSVFYFKKIFGLYPIYLNLLIILVALLYMTINLFSIKGDGNGF